MKHATLKLARRTLIGVAYVAFACRLMMPAGYMPAAWGEGGPVSLCPMGLPAGLLPEHSGHHHDEDGGSGTESLWEYCPLGALTDTASVVPDVLFHIPVFQRARPVEFEPGSFATVPRLGFRSRAPPLFVA